MDYNQVRFILKNSVGLKLLQSNNAPLIVSFLYHQFKQAHRVAIPLPELVERLDDYLEMLNEQQPGAYPRSAQNYLDIWCDDDHQFLRKYYEAEGEDPVFELTPGTEKAIGWLEELDKSEFIGTESRFLRVFDLLEEIVVRSTEDIEERLRQLEKKKAEIQQEIDEIKETGDVERYSATQIKERFFEASDTARRLLADFREVEQNFRHLSREIQTQRLKEGVKKGTLVAYVIDADAALKESDQGRSFYAFWDFLMSHAKQDELRDLLNKVYHLPELEILAQDNPLLRTVKNNLIVAGEKIIRSNQRLAEQLRKMLDEQHLAESRRVMELVGDIKRLALTVIAEPPPDEFFELEEEAQVELVMERPLWSPPEKPTFNEYDLIPEAQDLAAVDLDLLYDQFYVDEQRLRQNITKVLTIQGQVTLAELTTLHPIQKGLSEIVTYLAIATKDNHEINQAVVEPITYQPAAAADPLRQLALPQVIFRR